MGVNVTKYIIKPHYENDWSSWYITRLAEAISEQYSIKKIDARIVVNNSTIPQILVEVLDYEDDLPIKWWIDMIYDARIDDDIVIYEV